MRKCHDGQIKHFSTEAQTKVYKAPWGVIKGCTFPVNEQASGESCYGFENKQGSSTAFRKSQLDPTLWKVCTFTQLWMQMRSEGKEVKLSRFITMMVESKPFSSQSDSFVFDADGLPDKYADIPEDERKEFSEFLASGVQASMMVEALSEVPALCNGSRKRKDGLQGNDDNQKKRLSKVEEIQKAKASELDDRDGVEAEVQRSTKVRKMVSIDKLMNSKRLEKESPLNPMRVADLAKKIKENFDLSQMTLIVCPEDKENIYDENDEESTYVVISGRYRFEALKKLDNEGHFEALKGFDERKILCVVIDSQNSGIQSYVHNRSNKIQADVAGFRPENLVFSLLSLRETVKDKSEAAETIRRFAVNLELPGDEVVVLTKLATWNQEDLENLTVLLQAYKSFKTKDLEEKGSRFGSVLASGQSMPINKQFFKKIGRLTGEQVKEMKEAVLTKVVSLREAVEYAMKESDRQKTMSMAAQKLGNITTQELIREYKEFFTDQVLDSFRGSVFGKKSNQVGRDLEDYCDKILLNDSSARPEPKVEVKLVEQGLTTLEQIDVAVITGNKPKESMAAVEDIVKNIKNSSKCCGLVTVFKENEGIYEFKESLEKIVKKNVTEIYFTEAKGSEQNGYTQNIVYGLTVGKVMGKSIKKVNSDVCHSVRKIVESLSPPGAKVALFHLSTTLPLPLIHTASTKKAQYYITQSDEEKLRNKLKTDNFEDFDKNVETELEGSFLGQEDALIHKDRSPIPKD